jgi:hypothetical protein
MSLQIELLVADCMPSALISVSRESTGASSLTVLVCFPTRFSIVISGLGLCWSEGPLHKDWLPLSVRRVLAEEVTE